MSIEIKSDSHPVYIQQEGSNLQQPNQLEIETKLDSVLDTFSRDYGEMFKASSNENASINIIATQITASFKREYGDSLDLDNTYDRIVKCCRDKGVVKQLIDKKPDLEESYAEWVTKGLVILKDVDSTLNTQGNFDALVRVRGNAKWVADGLAILYFVDPVLVTQENFSALIDAKKNVPKVAEGLRILQADPKLVTQTNFDALIRSRENAKKVAKGLISLHNANPDLVTPENRDALIRSGENAKKVADGLISLHNANPDLVTPEHREALIRSGENAPAVADGLRILSEADPKLVTQANIDALVNAGPHVRTVIEGLTSLKKTDPALVTQGSFDALIKVRRNVELVATTADFIKMTYNPALATQKNCNEMGYLNSNLAFRGKGESIAEVFRILRKVDPELVTQANFDALIDPERNVRKIENELRSLREADPKLVTQANFDALIGGQEDKWLVGKLKYQHEMELQNSLRGPMLIQSERTAQSVVAKGIRILSEADPELETQTNFDALIKAGENASKVVNGLETLHRTDPKLVTQANFDALIAGNDPWLVNTLIRQHRK